MQALQSRFGFALFAVSLVLLGFALCRLGSGPSWSPYWAPSAGLTYPPPLAPQYLPPPSQSISGFAKFSQYTPSSYEQLWIDNAKAWASLPCRYVTQQDQQTSQWITFLHGDVTLPPPAPVFSRFDYRLNTTGETVTTFIEPLGGVMRHPYTCNELKKYIVEKDYILVDPRVRSLLVPGSRVFYFDLGASLWTSGMGGASQSWIVERFEAIGMRFDGIYAWEVSKHDPIIVWEQIPARLKAVYHWYNIPADPTPTAPNNPLRIIRQVARPDDFVILKLDIDNNPVEEQFIAQLLQDPSLSGLIDEMFFEHHVNLEPLATCCWGTKGSPLTLVDTLNLFVRIRQLGIRIHSWV